MCILELVLYHSGSLATSPKSGVHESDPTITEDLINERTNPKRPKPAHAKIRNNMSPSMLNRLFLKAAIISTAFTSSAIAQSTMPVDSYSTTYGSDSALIKHKSGCFASAVFRSNQCINEVNPINKFAVEYKGKIYCSIGHAPVIDKPLRDAYDRNSSVESICTMKGWVHQKK